MYYQKVNNQDIYWNLGELVINDAYLTELNLLDDEIIVRDQLYQRLRNIGISQIKKIQSFTICKYLDLKAFRDYLDCITTVDITPPEELQKRESAQRANDNFLRRYFYAGTKNPNKPEEISQKAYLNLARLLINEFHVDEDLYETDGRSPEYLRSKLVEFVESEVYESSVQDDLIYLIYKLDLVKLKDFTTREGKIVQQKQWNSEDDEKEYVPIGEKERQLSVLESFKISDNFILSRFKKV